MMDTPDWVLFDALYDLYQEAGIFTTDFPCQDGETMPYALANAGLHDLGVALAEQLAKKGYSVVKTAGKPLMQSLPGEDDEPFLTLMELKDEGTMFHQRNDGSYDFRADMSTLADTLTERLDAKGIILTRKPV